MPNTLSFEQREKMYVKRRMQDLNFQELAGILNCTKQDMINVQVGNPVPDEVAKAVLRWIRA